ncbi:arylesterase [Sinorhizobium sp. BG8]|uniref:arylesterase n=1 Tax=Sinorhizobium sp. BG8 TaxID=2613773 RepID=UPI00193C9471|nr:arylesterase [Sinorhizobium sp. BG8]QRM53494.1 arylesterase [Sinorhizobium sp. BG8]
MLFKAAHGIFTGMTLLSLAFASPLAAQAASLVGFGDSLMAGYQLPAEESFPAQLEKALKEKGFDITIVNAGVSGDTSSGGLARIDWSVPDGTQGVILELGANDALRGIPPEQTEKNLDAMIARLKERKVGVLLVGMLAPPNMGPEYAQTFNAIYSRLAEKHGIPLYPFFLDGVVTQAQLQLEDGMHPNGKGVAVMVERILPAVESFLTSLGKDG